MLIVTQRRVEKFSINVSFFGEESSYVIFEKTFLYSSLASLRISVRNRIKKVIIKEKEIIILDMLIILNY